MPESSAPAPIQVPVSQTLVQKIWKSWATRSLAVGAVATGMDLALSTTLLTAGLSTRPSSMIGTALGATFTFLANRYFAFREHRPELARPAARFIAVTLVSSVIHGQLVVILRDQWGVPFVPSKMISDLLVFTFAQLLMLRYVVFPKKKGPTSYPSE